MESYYVNHPKDPINYLWIAPVISITIKDIYLSLNKPQIYYKERAEGLFTLVFLRL